ncbi:MAG: hypothetical protein ACI9VR_003973 [Cognaticolwellia sp.]
MFVRGKIIVLAALWAIPSLAIAQSKTGSVQVNAGNATGEIIMDGFPMDVMAPGSVEGVPAGEHAFEVEYGCMLATGTFTVIAEDTVDANLDVENRGGEGTLRMRGLPSGADVLIDGTPVNDIDQGVQAKCGGRNVVIEADGFATWEETVVVTTGKWSRLEPVMVQGGMPVSDIMDDRMDDRYDDFDDGRPSGPDRPRVSIDEEMAELAEFDEPDSGSRGRDDLDDLDDLDGLDDFEDDEGASPRDDEFDELDELDELDGGSTREPREPRDGPGFPTRAVVTGAGAAVAVTGIVLTAQAQGTYSNAMSIHQGMVAANQTAQATVQMTQVVTPAKNSRNASIVLAIAGAGIGTAGFLMIEPLESSVAFVPSSEGRGGMVVLSGSF